jgi:hypothetical protein
MAMRHSPSVSERPATEAHQLRLRRARPQFLLQATPGPGFTGTLSFVCTGQPFGSVCTVPPSVTISGGAVTPFTISVSTLTPSAVAPESRPPSAPLQRPDPWQPLAVASLLIVLLASRIPVGRRYYGIVAPALNTIGAVFMAALLIVYGIGCGGGSSQATPPPQQEQQQQPQAATPSLLPAGGTFSGAQFVTISDTTAGATIYYTTDGTAPTASSLVYTSAISVNSATTVQAMATATNHAASTVASANYKFRTPAGSYTLTVIPTVTAAGSSKSWQLNAISLTLVVN